MGQSKQAKDRAGGYEIGLHKNRLSVPAYVSGHSGEGRFSPTINSLLPLLQHTIYRLLHGGSRLPSLISFRKEVVVLCLPMPDVSNHG